MPESLIWWLTVELIGAVAFPVAFVVFRSLPDRGYSFSKVLGLLLISYGMWIGGSAHLIPNSRWSIALVVALVAVLSGALAVRHRGEAADFLRGHWRLVLLIEGLFTAAFFTALFLRSYSYEISAGEKEMSFAFINASLRSRYFPADDPWLSGHPVPYYYFGHITVATVTKLVSVPSRIGFNLAVATFAALTATASFGLVYNLVRGPGRRLQAMLLGLVGTVFVMILSNLEGTVELLSAHGLGSRGFYALLDIEGLDAPTPSVEWFPDRPWWVFSAVNYAYGGPNLRFPFFDFLLGELDPQVLALPLVLTTLAMVLNLWRSADPIYFRYLRDKPIATVMGALVIGGLTFTHPWEVPTLLALLALTVAARNYVFQRERGYAFIVSTAAFVVPLALLSQLLFAPFFLTYSGNVPSLRPVEVASVGTVPLDAMVTRPHHFLYMWLPLLSLAAPFVAVTLMEHRPSPRMLSGAALPAILPLLAWGILISRHGPDGMRTEIAERGAAWLTLLFLVLAVTAVAWAYAAAVERSRRTGEPSNAPVALSLAGVAVLLLLGAELFWIKDPVSNDRFNTVLRFNWEAWTLLAVAGAFGLYHVLKHWPLTTLKVRLGWTAACGVMALVVLGGLAYPVAATFWRTDSFAGYRSLDGLAGIRRFQPAEYEALEWLWDHVHGSPVVLEATGGDYSYAGRVSTTTGLPTVLGWPWHEFQWRGSWAPQAGRKEDVERAYTTPDPREARAILEKYGVEYVYVGSLERAQYGEAGMLKFASFMDAIFENGSVTIYRVRRP